MCKTNNQQNRSLQTARAVIRYYSKRAAIVGSNRVLRGGSWNNNAQNCRSANRNWNSPDNRNNNIGFRLVFLP
ncbi:hypothetical protein EDS67_08620 [candidate division KSB1 bacterium]|nr:MAG: hypothetical protein EDS67_08620 [candidate division KSB1 bacterium]MBC6948819.1 hypothetical protein [candidate division KSB1 bacterium]MCE7942814.1 hypothetical protein [Chlorobi bacterium CHB1]MDL1873769.1 hypothetical protein [Cytophagia bacterium CHB2]